MINFAESPLSLGSLTTTINFAESPLSLGSLTTTTRSAEVVVRVRLECTRLFKQHVQD